MNGPNPVQALMGRLPEPGLEATLAAVRLGMVPVSEVLTILPGWPLLVLDTPTPETVEPLLLRGNTGDVFVAVFTSPDRAGSHADPARRFRWFPGGVIARGARPGVGVAVNIDSEPSLLVAPDTVAQLRQMPAKIVERTPGSRALTAIENAIVAANAGRSSVDEVRGALFDADLVLLSSTDPGSRDPSPAFSVGSSDRSLLAWTDPGLVRPMPDKGWAVTLQGRHLPRFLDGAATITLNPGTGLQCVLQI